MSEQPHEMQLVQTHASGAEEWHCPTCGRRFLMHWPPSYKKIVLEPGDEYAPHVGGKGGAQLAGQLFRQAEEQAAAAAPAHSPAADPPQARPLPVEELGQVPLTPELQPWLRYLSSLDA